MFRPAFTLKIENTRGQIFELSNNTKNYIVTDVSGLTYPASNINTSEGIADGAYYNSQRLQMRNIVITLRLRGDIEKNRQQLYTIFLAKEKCTIYYQNKNRHVKIDGYVEILEGSIFTNKEEIQISIVCPQPYFEGMTRIETDLSTLAKFFEFPFAIEVGEPISLSEKRNSPFATIHNSGSAGCGCILTVSVLGTIEGLTIINVTTQEKFGIDFELQAGDVLTINSTTGKKSCSIRRLGHEINLLFYRKPYSQWITLASGDNIFTFRTETGQDFAKIDISAVELYGGV